MVKPKILLVYSKNLEKTGFLAMLLTRWQRKYGLFKLLFDCTRRYIYIYVLSRAFVSHSPLCYYFNTGEFGYSKSFMSDSVIYMD